MGPKVSVLMPVYKTKEEHLRASMESILKQTFEDFEFLILDECPDDDREKIVKSYKDRRIKYFKNERNLGITPSRNKLILMAKGDYLAIFDHDDISLPERLEKEVAYLDEHPDVGVVGTKSKTIIRKRLSDNPVEDKEIKLALMRTCAIIHSSAMIRRSVLIEHNIRYEEEFSPSEDYALWCRLIPYTKFHNLPEVLFHYRDHEGNTSHNQKNKMLNATYAIWAFVKTANPEIYEEFLLKAKHTKQYKLLGLPIWENRMQGYRMKGYLFGLIPLLTYKYTIKLKEEANR